jgi:hypothetical protein
LLWCFFHCVLMFFLYSYIVLWCFSSLCCGVFSLFLHCVVLFFFIFILFCGVFVFIPTLCFDVFLYTYIVLWCFSSLINYTYILFLQCFVTCSFTYPIVFLHVLLLPFAMFTFNTISPIIIITTHQPIISPVFINILSFSGTLCLV